MIKKYEIDGYDIDFIVGTLGQCRQELGNFILKSTQKGIAGQLVPYPTTGMELIETVLERLEKIKSFLTSQEVCEWIRIGKEKYHTGCSKGTDITLMQIDLNMIYCPQCGKKIKEVSM